MSCPIEAKLPVQVVFFVVCFYKDINLYASKTSWDSATANYSRSMPKSAYALQTHREA